MNSNLVIPTAVLVVIVAAAFVMGRLRVGDWQPRRDAVVLGGIALLGVIAVLAVLAPPAIALVGIPTALALAGLYLLSKRPPSRTSRLQGGLILIAAGGAVALGIFGLVIAFVRRSP